MTLSQVKPALLTMMSSPSNSSSAVFTKRSPNSGSTTLPVHVTAVPPAARLALTGSLAGSASRSLTTTRAPSLASLSAMARPIPRPAPLTKATLPSSFIRSALASRPDVSLRDVARHEALDLAIHGSGAGPKHHGHVVSWDND